jgi:hypothetical protein
MLLCLNREQQHVLAEILGVTDVTATEILDLSREAFRQRPATPRTTRPPSS